MGHHSTLSDHPDIRKILVAEYGEEKVNKMRVCRYSARKVKQRIGEIETDGLRYRVFGKDGSCELVYMPDAKPLSHA